MSTRPQKILYVITKSNWGGAQRYVYDLAVSSKSYKLKANSSNAIVALGGNGLLKNKLEAAGIRVVTIPALKRDVGLTKDVRALFALLALYRREQPDVIHLNSSKAAGLGALAARIYNMQYAASNMQQALKRLAACCLLLAAWTHSASNRKQNSVNATRIVTTLHGLPHLEPRPRFEQTLIKFFTWLTVLLSHKTITVSQHDYKIIRTWPFCRNRAVVVHNGIDTIAFTERTRARSHLIAHIQNTRYEIKDISLVVGTIAELHPNKGLDVLIEAIAFLKAKSYKLKAFVVGAGELHSSLASLIAERGLSEHVVLTGHIENAARLLPAFDIFILPSRKEGLPYVLIEALHAGVPIVASRAGGIPEIIVHEETGLLVEPEDSRELAEAIERLANNAELRVRLSTRARAHAHIFSLEHMITKTAALYEL